MVAHIFVPCFGVKQENHLVVYGVMLCVQDNQICSQLSDKIAASSMVRRAPSTGSGDPAPLLTGSLGPSVRCSAYTFQLDCEAVSLFFSQPLISEVLQYMNMCVVYSLYADPLVCQPRPGGVPQLVVL